MKLSDCKKSEYNKRFYEKNKEKLRELNRNNARNYYKNNAEYKQRKLNKYYIDSTLLFVRRLFIL